MLPTLRDARTESADCLRAIREALPAGAVFLELRPHQLAVVSKHGPAFIGTLKETAGAVFTRAGVRAAIGGAIFEPGAALDTVLADAERALAESKRQGAPQGLLELQSSLQRDEPRNADSLV